MQTIKCVVVGDGAVGKVCFCSEFLPNHTPHPHPVFPNQFHTTTYQVVSPSARPRHATSQEPIQLKSKQIPEPFIILYTVIAVVDHRCF